MQNGALEPMPYLTTFIDEAEFIGEYDGYQMFCIPTRHSSVWIIRTRSGGVCCHSHIRR
jgi:hypothetical protein